jgi:predicted N-formylglutamate amidohydrolase
MPGAALSTRLNARTMHDALKLISLDEPEAVEIVPGGGRVVLACDHASKRVPRVLGTLGLTGAELARHIGWDIGAAALTRALAVRLSSPAVLARYSRLVIDCNRDPADKSSIPEESDEVPVPGNRGLSEPARAARRAAIFDPYHAGIAAWIDDALARGPVPALISIHSFTPAMGGVERPWQVGILWDADDRIAQPLMAALRAAGFAVGDNQPYSAKQPAGYTQRHHALARGLPHVAIEVRQDEIGDDAGASLWAGRLASALAPILAGESLYRLWKNRT